MLEYPADNKGVGTNDWLTRASWLHGIPAWTVMTSEAGGVPKFIGNLTVSIKMQQNLHKLSSIFQYATGIKYMWP